MTRAALLAVLLIAGCDAVKTAPAPMTAGSTTAAPATPFTIEPRVWGEAEAQQNFEVRTLPGGAPGLFTSEGALLLNLLPELIIDAAEAQKSRPRPVRLKFDVVKLEPNPAGGFALYARAKDDNVRSYDLRVEVGPNDPRVHVGLVTKWGRDVKVQREILAFRTGPLGTPHGLRHDYEWIPVEGEWVGAAHAPRVIQFAGMTVMGRSGVENVAARAVEDRWDVELEAYHWENHPLEAGDDCAELEGAAIFAGGTQSELRADFVLGEVSMPLWLRYPEARRAAVALGEPDATEDGCTAGRLTALANRGLTSTWSGTTTAIEGTNFLAPTEADSRRVFGFRHPNGVLPMFVLPDAAASSSWFDERRLAELKSDWGLVAGRAPLDELLGADASPTQTVREVIADAAVWVADPGDVARRLVAMGMVDLELRPDGVVRVWNASDVDVPGVALLLPEGTEARYPTGTVHSNAGRTTWFDLEAGGSQLLQLFRADEPFWVARPAGLTIATDPAP